jgi:hypothetical protein
LRSPAAAFVDKILKGSKPVDLPVPQATRYLLIINRKTALALGPALPRQLLMRADQVIEWKTATSVSRRVVSPMTALDFVPGT